MTLPIEDLRWRIFNVFPAGELALDHLLGVLSIRYSSRISTAAVKNQMPPSLLLNPEFIEKYCRTDEHLLMILMHEMYHLILGHTRLFPLMTPAHNFAFDAVINSMICKSMPGYEYISFFTGFYRDDRIEALLRPPELWSPGQGNRARWKLKGDLLEAHKALYTEKGDLTYRDIFELVIEEINEDSAVLLLGGHDEDETDGGLSDPNAVKAIAEVVGKWPALERRQGRDRGRDVEEFVQEPEKPEMSVSRIIRKSIARLAQNGHGSQQVHRPSQRETLLPFPTLPDRRASVMRGLGQCPVFFRGEVQGLRRETAGQVHIYLDVSGSMDDCLGIIFGCLRPVQTWLHPMVHIFSTEVMDHPLKRILKGRYESTSGTDINCVLEHIIGNKIRKAAIITDGYVGEPSEMLLRKLPKRVKFVKLLTPDYYENDIDHLPGSVHRLPI